MVWRRGKQWPWNVDFEILEIFYDLISSLCTVFGDTVIKYGNQNKPIPSAYYLQFAVTCCFLGWTVKSQET